MGVVTSIEWADATVNPGIYGCAKVSQACNSCYAMRMAHRQVAMGNYPVGVTRLGSRGPEWTGNVYVDYARIPHAFDALPKRRPARVFVTSMADLFHRDVPDPFIETVFVEMNNRPHLTFQVLTKRPERIRPWYAASVFGLSAIGWPSNVWIGTTVEDQQRADERIPALLRVPAAVRFLSCEPLLSAVVLPPDFLALGQRGWCIGGGESGPHARPTHPAWARALRDQCVDAGIPFFWKQWGCWAPGEDVEANGTDWPGMYAHDPRGSGVPRHSWPDASIRETARRLGKGELGAIIDMDTTVLRVGKKAAGRLLDGREWSQFPESR